MAKNRFRLQFKFWLDMNKPDEYELAETIAELKENKSFSRGVRDGLRLMVDLWRGNLDVLLELFPDLEETFYERFKAQQPASEHALKEQLSNLERLLMAQGNVPVSGPKALTKVVPSAPPDDDLLVMKKAKSKGDSAKNFLDSAFNLVQ